MSAARERGRASHEVPKLLEVLILEEATGIRVLSCLVRPVGFEPTNIVGTIHTANGKNCKYAPKPGGV